ncbi:MAG: TIGR00266 family protein [Pseudomonadota bacterium]
MATFTVTDGQDPFLHVSLQRGESVFAESDAMVMMDDTLDLSGNVQGGFLSGLARRLVADESLFTQKVVATRGPGDLLLSQVVPGGLHVFDVGTQQYMLSDGAFLAAETSVEIKVRSQGLGGALFGASGGFFIMQTSGTGKLCVGGFGSLFLLTIQPGQNPVIDNGHVVAWDSRLSYDMVMGTSRQGGLLSNLVSSQTSGEGLVMKFSGSGQVLVCSRKRAGFAAWLRQQLGNARN